MPFQRERLSDKSLDNFVEVLQHWNDRLPDKEVFMELNNDLTVLNSITYHQLFTFSLINSQHIQSNIESGNRCLLVFNSGIEFITGFFACMMSGVIPVSVLPPKKNRKNDRFHRIMINSGAKAILTSRKFTEDIKKQLPFVSEKKQAKLLHLKTNSTKDQALKVEYKSNHHNIAFIQYTSGSTSVPNGIAITHHNLLSNSAIIQKSFNLDQNLISATWLPFIHDMGLIGSMLQNIYSGGSGYMIPPATFVRDPLTWIKMITRFECTISGCPNFALDYCVQKIKDKDLKNLNLSSLKVLFTGSEPVLANTLNNFYRKFRSTGFRKSMYLPCYGLAESTLMVSGIDQKEEPLIISVDKSELLKKNKISTSIELNDKIELVSSGYCWENHTVKIVDTDKLTILGDNQIGEIWIKGESVGSGYWRDPEKTKEVFNTLTSNGEGPFLRSGDLGFIHKKHLFVTGRIKEMIIIRGKNYYPHDIEQSTMKCHPALQEYAGAAFSTDINGKEQLILVSELKRTFMQNYDKEDIVQSIKETISMEHGLQVYSIILVTPYSIPKTTSGKIQRNLVRSNYNTGNLNELFRWENPAGNTDKINTGTSSTNYYIEILTWLVNWLSEKLKIEPGNINPEKNIMSYGLDSMAAVELERDIKEKFDIEIELSEFLENNKISYIAQRGFLLLSEENNP